MRVNRLGKPTKRDTTAAEEPKAEPISITSHEIDQNNEFWQSKQIAGVANWDSADETK